MKIKFAIFHIEKVERKYIYSIKSQLVSFFYEDEYFFNLINLIFLINYSICCQLKKQRIVIIMMLMMI